MFNLNFVKYYICLLPITNVICGMDIERNIFTISGKYIENEKTLRNLKENEKCLSIYFKTSKKVSYITPQNSIENIYYLDYFAKHPENLILISSECSKQMIDYLKDCTKTINEKIKKMDYKEYFLSIIKHINIAKVFTNEISIYGSYFKLFENIANNKEISSINKNKLNIIKKTNIKAAKMKFYSEVPKFIEKLEKESMLNLGRLGYQSSVDFYDNLTEELIKNSYFVEFIQKSEMKEKMIKDIMSISDLDKIVLKEYKITKFSKLYEHIFDDDLTDLKNKNFDEIIDHGIFYNKISEHPFSDELYKCKNKLKTIQDTLWWPFFCRQTLLKGNVINFEKIKIKEKTFNNLNDLFRKLQVNKKIYNGLSNENIDVQITLLLIGKKLDENTNNLNLPIKPIAEYTYSSNTIIYKESELIYNSNSGQQSLIEDLEKTETLNPSKYNLIDSKRKFRYYYLDKLDEFLDANKVYEINGFYLDRTGYFFTYGGSKSTFALFFRDTNDMNRFFLFNPLIYTKDFYIKSKDKVVTKFKAMESKRNYSTSDGLHYFNINDNLWLNKDNKDNYMCFYNDEYTFDFYEWNKHLLIISNRNEENSFKIIEDYKSKLLKRSEIKIELKNPIRFIDFNKGGLIFITLEKIEGNNKLDENFKGDKIIKLNYFEQTSSFGRYDIVGKYETKQKYLSYNVLNLDEDNNAILFNLYDGKDNYIACSLLNNGKTTDYRINCKDFYPLGIYTFYKFNEKDKFTYLNENHYTYLHNPIFLVDGYSKNMEYGLFMFRVRLLENKIKIENLGKVNFKIDDTYINFNGSIRNITFDEFSNEYGDYIICDSTNFYAINRKYIDDLLEFLEKKNSITII